MGRSRTGRQGFPGLAGLSVIALLVSTACLGSGAQRSAAPPTTPPGSRPAATPPPARPSLVVPSAAIVSAAPAVSLAPLPPELVGTWRTSTWLNADGSQADWRIYRFMPDGTYDYTVAECTPDCVVQGYEWGYARVANGTIALSPQSNPSDGPRAWPYAVGRDPNVGDVQLHLTLPDGQVDIFYFG